jgi:hypothetical protein
MPSPRIILVIALLGTLTGLAFRVLWLLRLRHQFREPLPGALPYRARRAHLSATEFEFYTALCHAVKGRSIVCIKVRLADVIDCPPAVWRMGYGRLIAQKHLDFVLCDPETIRIRAGIELDDRSHSRGDRRARDRFVEAAMHAAAVPLVRLPAAAAYCPDQVSRTLKKALG